MHPILFEISGISVHAYGLLGAIGFLTIAFMTLRRARTIGVETDALADLIFYTSIMAMVGARLVYVLQTPELMGSWRDVINLRAGGLVFYGSLLVGIPFGSWYMRRRKMPFLATWDVFATAMPIGHAITRVGCLMAGCCYGLPSDAPWAVTYTNLDGVAPLNIALHPVQLYEAGWLLVVGIITNIAWSRKKFDGQIMALYLMAYAGLRYFIETFRGDTIRGTEYFDMFSTSQLGSIGMATAGLLLALYGLKRGFAPETPYTAENDPTTDALGL